MGWLGLIMGQSTKVTPLAPYQVPTIVARAGWPGYNHGTINSGYATGNVSGGSPVGGLAGYNWRGTIISSYATGSVEARGTGTAGGLVGRSATVGNRIDEERDSWVISSYATGSVKGGVRVGGLIGHLLHPSLGQRGGDHPSKIGIVASYATGSVEGNIQVGGLIGAIHERSDADEAVTITASYATGSVQGNTSVGGLIGYRDNDAAGGTRVSSSYWDTQTSGQSAGVGDGDPTGVQGRTTTQLQAPTGYTGIYTNWNADLDNADGDDNSATETDDFWDFGTSSQYPALKADIDENGTPTWQEFGGQRGDVPTYTPPEAPTGLTAMEPEPTQITFSWTAPSDNGGAPITAYDLRHIETGAADKSDANWTVKEDVWTTGSGPLQYSLTGLTGLTGSTQYDVQVRGVNAAGESEWSATVTGTTAPPVAPEAPTGLTARVVSGEAQVVLSWTAPANTGGAPITGYKIEASDDGNTSWTEVHTTTGAGAGYTDLGDDGDGPMFGVEEVRHYRVSAVNSVGEGAPSNVAKAEDLVGRYDADGNGTIEKREVIQAIKDYLFGEGNEAISKGDVIRLIKLYLFGPSTPHNRPGAPEGLTAAGNGQTRIDLSWAAPSDDGGADITGYKIEVSPNGSSWSDLEGNTLSTSTSYSHSSLTAGSTRHYRVSAINSEGTGPASNVVTGTTDAGNAASNADTDRAALGALYNATNGANWHDKDNWQSGAPMGEWHGVTTDSDGRVTHLSLYNNQLTGEIPAELGNLTNLEGLQLRTNQLTGEIPAELGNLTNLELLTLYRNQLTGEIPAELGSLPNLKGLSLYRNQLTGEIPAELGEPDQPETGLSLYQQPVDRGDTGGVGGQPGTATSDRGDTGGVGLTNLLQLHSNQLTGEIPVELGNLANLQTLYLFNNQLTGEIPAELGNLTNLEGLFLNNNQLTGEIPAELGSLPNLKGLSLYRNQLTGEIPAELGNLTNLEGLSLSSNQLTGEIPAELGSLTNLELLTLYRNQLSGCIPAGLRDVPDNDLDELGLADCASGDAASDRAALVALYNATGGANWGNNGNWLSNAPMGEWHRVTTDSDGRVTDLSLTSNQLTGAIPVELGDLTSLKRLSLSFNQLTGEIPAELGDLTNLTHLYLRINQLTGARYRRSWGRYLTNLEGLGDLWKCCSSQPVDRGDTGGVGPDQPGRALNNNQ